MRKAKAAGFEFAAVNELLELLSDKNGQTLFGLFGGCVHGQWVGLIRSAQGGNGLEKAAFKSGPYTASS
jgi:hypothetical protein